MAGILRKKIEKGIIWHMPETIGFNPEAERANKVQAIKNRLVEAAFLNPNQEQKDKLSEKLKGVFDSELKHGTNSVVEIDETINDINGTYTELQKENARKDKSILTEATVLAAKDLRDKNEISTNDLFLGSKHMENMLPQELKGLGREVTKSFINNDEIDKQLNALEITRQNLDVNNPSSIETFVQKLDVRIKKLAVEDYEDEESVGEQDAALTALNEEKRKYVVNSKKENNSENENGPDLDFIDDSGPNDISSDGPDKKGGLGVRWEISPEYAAEAMKFMDSGMRWQSYTPPEWMKKLDPETQARIEYMVMVNDGAASLSYAGKDLDKIQGNKLYFAFDNEKMTKLFNPDFKLVMSKMLNDLCEPYVDKNGQKCIKYKEGLNQKEKPGIKADVEIKLENIRDYKEEMADFLAKENGRKEANYMDKMNAYTAWNLFYMFGDSSVADRRRVLPTYGGIISDGLRTLNPEYKALGKWKISKADKPQSNLEAAEWFGGPLGVYVQTVMQLERDLGHDGKDKPITGNKTLREKMIDGDISLLNTKTFYGFLDFTAGGRDLYDKNGDKFYDKDKGKKREETLASLLMNYGFEKDGRLKPKDQREDFSFGHNQVDFLNWYRDQMEASALVLNATTGKEDVRDVDKFISKIRTAFGMVDGIDINGDHPFKYTKNPDLWANMLLGSFGVDIQRLSTDYIYLKTTQPQSYALNVSRFIIYGLSLSDNDVDTKELMRRLGIDIKNGESIDGFGFTIRNEIKWKNAKKTTDELIRRSHHK